MPEQLPRVQMVPITMMVDRVPVDLCTEGTLRTAVQRHLLGVADAPLAVGSVNLDHLHHFSMKSPHNLGYPGSHGGHGIDWALLADGAPVAARAARLTGQVWPRLTGADLLPAILADAEASHSTVGFFGGFPDLHKKLQIEVAARFPGLGRSLFWAPTRGEIEDPRRSLALAREIERAGVDVLVVGLGKPRQELWMERYGVATGAKVLLAFGAAADFLAGSTKRAPELMQGMGLEWLYRVGQEPRRLTRRYLVEGPPGLRTLRRAHLAADFASAIR